MQIIKLKFRQTADRSFLVTLSCNTQPWEVEGGLVPFPDALRTSLQQWRTTYRALEEVRSLVSKSADFRIIPKSVQVSSSSECINAVKTQLNLWLNHPDAKWQTVREGLISFANQFSESEIQIILNAQNIDLCRLPWQEWDLLRQYFPDTEIAISTPTAKDLALKTAHPQLVRSKKVRILLVVGKSDGINTKADLAVIQQLLAKKAEIVYLLQPSLKELASALWCARGYHIFIFTGHSGSDRNGTIGWIEVNDTERLAIAEFKDSFKQAISGGLQLAIFNSCDGLGLADRLSELNLAQIIVMSEPVPDEIAIEFLEHFFQEFVNQNSLFSSIQKARQKLEHFNTHYPGAAWLPTLCLKPVPEYATWDKLTRSPEAPFNSGAKQPSARLFNRLVKVILSLTGAIVIFFTGLTLNTISPQLASQIPPGPFVFLAKYLQPQAEFDLPSGSWQYSGSTTWELINNLVRREIINDDFKLIYTRHPILPNGSGTGIRMLIDGQVSFALSSRPVNDSEYDAAIVRGKILKQVPVAIDGVAIVVNPQLNIDHLTIRQLADIYQGKITNWAQIGGQDLAVVPYARSLSSGTTEFFRNNILKDRTYGKNVVFVEESNLAIANVKSSLSSGGIYFLSASEIINDCQLKIISLARRSGSPFVSLLQPDANCDPTVRESAIASHLNNRLNIEVLQTGEYPLARRLFMIIEINSPIDEEVGEAYKNLLLSQPGQKIVSKAGFIAIRSFSE